MINRIKPKKHYAKPSTIKRKAHRLEVENESTFSKAAMAKDEKSEVNLVQDSIQFKDGQCEVGIPQKKILGVCQIIIMWY